MRKCFSLLFISLILSFIFGFPANGIASARDVGLPAAATSYDLVGAVNALRASNGLAPYNVNSILMKIAQDQANYLASTGGAYGHIGLGGTLPYQRALNAGYAVAGALPPGLFSENWVQASSVQTVIKFWQGDAAHRIALYSTDLYDIGGGVASGGGMTYYVIDTGASTGSKPLSASNSTGGATTVVVNGTPVSQEQMIPMAIVSTPNQAGEVYHIVQQGQTLWQIAIAYKVKINDIKQLNPSVGPDNVIQAGQKLLIMHAATLTPVPPTAPPTLDLSTFTPLPTLEVVTETVTSTATATPAAPTQSRNGAPVVGGIIFIAMIAAGLIAWIGRQRPI
jgi:LysM repeat protein